MTKILVINAGSSSLKFSVMNMPEEKEIAHGLIGRIGLELSEWKLVKDGISSKGNVKIANHSEAFSFMLSSLKENRIITSTEEIGALGHRVLHGGEKYKKSVIVTQEVLRHIKYLTKLGPLHHPGNLAGIKSMKDVLPNVPMVAVFDTAFHQTMPDYNYMYPVPYEWYTKYGVRKYGFHGTSHKYITNVMQEKLGRKNVNLIICHIGSGASISAIKDGKCHDTTMGLTPLDGLMMGTRSGAIDPSILEYVCKESGKSIEEITNSLNKESGFQGVCGVADCRDVEEADSQGSKQATLALKMYCDRIAKYIAQYYLELEGKVDAIIFTAGVGENGNGVRKSVIDTLNPIGIYLDDDQNDKIASYKEVHQGKISTEDSKVDVLVIPTDEEIMIVRDAYELVK